MPLAARRSLDSKSSAPLVTLMKTSSVMSARLAAFALFAASVVFGLLPPAAYAASASDKATGSATCHGQNLLSKVISDTNWDDFYPIVVDGMSIGDRGQPPLVKEPTPCYCPGYLTFGAPAAGIGVTYWQPLYMAEVTRSPGCLISMGTHDQVLKGYGNLTGNRSGITQSSGGTRSGGLLQVHWYVYPLFQMLDMSLGSVCGDSSDGFSLVGMSEIDPAWNNDMWSAVIAPEAVLVANPIMQFACIVDAISTTFSYPLDAMFWCDGSWGDSIYPLSGNVNSAQSSRQANALALTKFMALEARLGLLKGTIGYPAECGSYTTYFLPRSQFRVNPVYPIAKSSGPSIYLGQTVLRWAYAPPGNFPLNQDSAYLMWNAQQCCMHY